MKKGFTLAMMVLLSATLMQCGRGEVIPEMKEFVNSFGSQEKLTAVIEKYGTPKVVPEAMQACDLEKPIITKTEKKDGTFFYTAEATVAKCERSENAVGTTRVFTMGWKDGKIVSFEWKGPKSGNVEY